MSLFVRTKFLQRDKCLAVVTSVEDKSHKCLTADQATANAAGAAAAAAVLWPRHLDVTYGLYGTDIARRRIVIFLCGQLQGNPVPKTESWVVAFFHSRSFDENTAYNEIVIHSCVTILFDVWRQQAAVSCTVFLLFYKYSFSVHCSMSDSKQRRKHSSNREIIRIYIA